mmetsp:Transcript_15950/g.26728  ORF Transcript_15950/g.26728 Transcript_15950/m.26728 type:complete len:202 (+) Transcript_15950:183-788(+)
MSISIRRQSSASSLVSDEADSVSSRARSKASVKRAASLHTPKSIKAPSPVEKLKRKNSRMTTVSTGRKRGSRRYRTPDAIPILDSQLLKEQEMQQEQERREFEENKSIFAARTQHRKKFFAPNGNSMRSASVKFDALKERGRTRLLGALSRRAQGLSGGDALFQDDDVMSTDQYSMSFAQPAFKDLMQFDKEFNSDYRVRG